MDPDASQDGRGAFYSATAVNADPSGGRRFVRNAGADRKEDVGISNDNANGKFAHRKSKVS